MVDEWMQWTILKVQFSRAYKYRNWEGSSAIQWGISQRWSEKYAEIGAKGQNTCLSTEWNLKWVDTGNDKTTVKIASLDF